MSTHSDVLIVGAGLSGIGAAYHLQREAPWASYRILEGREAIGGTWDIFRYPGIRSDSDMFTLGYEFKPWQGGKVLADGPSIRRYVRETAEENGIVDRIDFRKRVVSAAWNSDKACWTVLTRDPDSGEEQSYSCNFLFLCAGYYSYRAGHTPEFPGCEDFGGDIIHPQDWPEDYDYRGKRIVVIGSGATAVTLVPALAEKAGHVTMLQRSPTYMFNRPEYDSVGLFLGKILPPRTAYALTRWKNFRAQWLIYTATRYFPGLIKKLLLSATRRQLPEGYDLETHFSPRYNPWDQRLCAVPDNDLYAPIRDGRAEVVTEEVDAFVREGIRLKSGRVLEADLIVTATGLELVVNGEVAFSMDGEPIDFSKTWTYKGLMFSGVPNLVNTFGYINSSWTLRADLIARFVSRLVNAQREKGMRQVTPQLRPEDRDMPPRPFIDDFSAGYIARSAHLFPRQGDREPWINCQNYSRERRTIGRASLDDGVLQFSNPVPSMQQEPVAEASLSAGG